MSQDPVRMPFLLIPYQEYLEHPDAEVFSGRVSQFYTPGTLQRLVRHPSREIRRAAVLALGFVGDYTANHPLGCALHDDDRTVRTLAENAIRTVWTRAGNESERAELDAIIHLNTAHLYRDAVARATKLIERAPWFAEAWHQRAVAHYAEERYVESIRDCHQTLEINPYHFIAAASMGQAYLELLNQVSALECFRRALRLNPDLEAVRVQVARLTRAVDGNR